MQLYEVGDEVIVNTDRWPFDNKGTKVEVTKRDDRYSFNSVTVLTSTCPAGVPLKVYDCIPAP